MASAEDKPPVGVSLYCPACTNVIKDPRILPCLHSICKTCIEKQLNGNFKCPVCNDPSRNIKSPRDIENLPTDSLLNSVLDMVALHGGRQVQCDICDESEHSTAVSRCKECALYFCSLHSHAHKTAKHSKGHAVMYLSELRKYPLRDLRRPLYCPAHPMELLAVFCQNCDKPVCKDCCHFNDQNNHVHIKLHDAIEKYNTEIDKLLQQAKHFCTAIEETIPSLDLVATDVNSKAKKVLSEIDVIFDYQITTLLKRKKDLRDQVQEIRKTRIAALKGQQQSLENSLGQLQHACKFTEINLTTSNSHKDGTTLVLKNMLTSRLTQLMEKEMKHLEPVENAFLRLHCDDSLLHQAVQTFGRLDTTFACPRQCIARGVGIKAAPVTQPVKFIVFLNDRHGKPLGRSDEVLNVEITTHDGRRVNVDSIVNKHDGTYEVTYTPMQRGRVTIIVKIKGQPIQGCPYIVAVTSSLRKSWI